MYGEGALTDGMCQKWFVKFHAGDFSLDDAPQSDRPVETDGDQIETLIENNQHSTTRERADILKTSNSMKLFSENEKCVFYFMEKTKQTFWPAPCIVTSSWGWATCHRDYCPHTATPVDACSALLALGTGRGLACQRRRGLHGS